MGDGLTSRLKWLRNALFVDELVSASETRPFLRSYLLGVGFAVALVGPLLTYLVTQWNFELSPGQWRLLDLFLITTLGAGGGLCTVFFHYYLTGWLRFPEFFRSFCLVGNFLGLVSFLAYVGYALATF